MNKLGLFEEAIESYDKCLTIDPNFFIAYYCKGLLLNNLGLYLEAIACYNQCLNIDLNKSFCLLK